MSDRKITLEFNDKVVRQFLLASLIWGAVGMLVGVLIASQLNFCGSTSTSRGSRLAGCARCTPTPSSSPSWAT